VGAKYDTRVMPSPSLAAGGGDKKNTGADDEGRGMRQTRLQRWSLALRRRTRALGAEEVEMVAASGG
jgi:hypothetical protein